MGRNELAQCGRLGRWIVASIIRTAVWLTSTLILFNLSVAYQLCLENAIPDLVRYRSLKDYSFRSAVVYQLA